MMSARQDGAGGAGAAAEAVARGGGPGVALRLPGWFATRAGGLGGAMPRLQCPCAACGVPGARRQSRSAGGNQRRRRLLLEGMPGRMYHCMAATQV